METQEQRGNRGALGQFAGSQFAAAAGEWGDVRRFRSLVPPGPALPPSIWSCHLSFPGSKEPVHTGGWESWGTDLQGLSAGVHSPFVPHRHSLGNTWSMR